MIFQRQPGPRVVPVPFVQRPIGAGDVVKRMTEALGVKPCSPCERRRQLLNQLMQFRPVK